MNNFIQNVQQQIYDAGEWTTGMAENVNDEVQDGLLSIKDQVENLFHNGSEKCHAGAMCTRAFVLRNKETLFFIFCTSATAIFAPHLFVPAAIVTIIFRVELSQYLKELAQHYLKEENNPYLTHPLFGPNYISSFDVTLATIAMIDTIALRTIPCVSALSLTLFPILGGIAAGNCLAKVGMDIAHKHF